MAGMMPKSSMVLKWAKHGSTGNSSCAGSGSELSELDDASTSMLWPAGGWRPAGVTGGPAETPGPPLPAPTPCSSPEPPGPEAPGPEAGSSLLSAPWSEAWAQIQK